MLRNHREQILLYQPYCVETNYVEHTQFHFFKRLPINDKHAFALTFLTNGYLNLEITLGEKMS